jgi:hypothetical protein
MNMVVLRRLTSLTRHRLWDWLAMQFGAEAVVDIDALHRFLCPPKGGSCEISYLTLTCQ